MTSKQRLIENDSLSYVFNSSGKVRTHNGIEASIVIVRPLTSTVHLLPLPISVAFKSSNLKENFSEDLISRRKIGLVDLKLKIVLGSESFTMWLVGHKSTRVRGRESNILAESSH